MNKKVLFTIEFLGVVLAVSMGVIVLEVLSRHEVLTTDYMYHAIKQADTNKKLVIIGNSHSGNFHQTDMLNYPSSSILNLSIGGQDLFHGYLLAEQMLRTHATTTECLLLCLDYDVMGYTLAGTNQKYLDRQYYKYADTMQDMSLANRMMAKSSFFRCNRHFQLHRRQKASASVVTTATDSTAIPNFIPVESTNAKDSVFCKKRAWEMTMIKFDKDKIAENKRILKAYIALCQKYNVRLVIVIPPKTDLFCQYAHAGNTLLGKQAIYSVLQAADPMECYDFYEDTAFTDVMFIDADHLNAEGISVMANAMNNNNKKLPHHE